MGVEPASSRLLANRTTQYTTTPLCVTSASALSSASCTLVALHGTNNQFDPIIIQLLISRHASNVPYPSDTLRTRLVTARPMVPPPMLYDAKERISITLSNTTRRKSVLHLQAIHHLTRAVKTHRSIPNMRHTLLPTTTTLLSHASRSQRASAPHNIRRCARRIRPSRLIPNMPPLCTLTTTTRATHALRPLTRPNVP